MEVTINSQKHMSYYETQPSICICPKCGGENVISFDGFRSRQICSSCGKEMELSKCAIY